MQVCGLELIGLINPGLLSNVSRQQAAAWN
jgi:hypothetical protein